MDVNFVRSEVVYALNNIHEWMKPQRVQFIKKFLICDFAVFHYCCM